MQNAAGLGASTPSDERNVNYRSIVSELESLIVHVQSSMGRIESAIASESPFDNPETTANVVVLDDVTPRYAKANAALNACNAALGVALHFLLDARTSNHRPNGPAACDRARVRLIGGAG